MSVCIADFFGVYPIFCTRSSCTERSCNGETFGQCALKQLSLLGPALEFKRKYTPTLGIAIKLITGNAQQADMSFGITATKGFRGSLVIDF